MNTFLITIGSNTDNGLKLISKCIDLIKEDSVEAVFSSIYRTEAEGIHSVGTYLNSVGLITTDRDICYWETMFKDIELQYGRTDEMRKKHIVPIDIDITIWNDEIIRPANLKMNYIKKGLYQIGVELPDIA